VRGLRRQRGWTLQQVSERTGLPISTLSKVENDQLTLSYDKLMDLAEGFEIDVAELFGSSGQRSSVLTGRRSVTMPGEGRPFETQNYIDHYLCSDLRSKRMNPAISRIRSRSLEEFGPLVRHESEEFLHVLSGTIAVHTEFYEPLILPQGASLYIDSSMGHAYLSVGDVDAWVLVVVCNRDETQPEVEEFEASVPADDSWPLQ
jgi:transcriptional regulator with XRE-family HTH domain